ncbi:hypothetical protein [Microbacterium rhizosphaerae]|jgi:hypothetical protein|uniref:DUF2631 domain-containing protein n=1 Tax=Microbacterium rhizosphaerae TaxID=1678237 RepID=A0ABZ0SIQ8_9MICO|nr:hypothetical protein [Microbacterium rhizosphaerae]WPR89246.1 hypothetical protein SM116_16010 [Microbacterium rhizosphaerae]
MTYSPGSGPSPTGWPRGRKQWIFGTIVLIGLGALVGLLLGNIWIGLLLAAVVSIGWIMAYESSRGRNVGMHEHGDDGDDNGARL